MKHLISLIIILVASSSIFAEKNSFEINESLTQVFFRDNNLQTLLNVTNMGKKLNAKVEFEVLDVRNRSLVRMSGVKAVERGGNALQFKIPFNVYSFSNQMIWHRLRYTISTAEFKKTGIVSLSEVMPELYSLRAAASNNIYPGMNYVVRVRAFHPIRSYVISGVKIDANLNLFGEKDGSYKQISLKGNGVTDEKGYATLQFQIPADFKFRVDNYRTGNIRINGDKNGLKESVNSSLRSIKSGTFVYLNTDKPLYQPNQKISIRGLVLENNVALRKRKTVADKNFEFKIRDEENKILYKETVATSRFGVASIDWQIPDNAKLGKYKIEVAEDGKNPISFTSFKVSRYELPNFIVKTKNDKDFYLPKDTTAQVTIDAVYLFGKDVAGGKVKIVRESDRTWNYLKQKWDIDEEETYEGKTDKDGNFKQKIDLSEAHEELEDGDNKSFEDLKFSAYFTDSTTNITEQRRFDIRVSKEPIHIYLIGWDKNRELNNKFPQEFYVTTSSADGKPIASDVEIKGRYESEENKNYKTLARFRTNEFGAAKVKFKLPKCKDECLEDFVLKVVASNAKNEIGTFEDDEVAVDDDENQIRIRTKKTIYKTSEPLKIEILSTAKRRTVFVDLMRDGSSLSSHKVFVKNGRGKLTIPYQKSFKSDLQIVAYFGDSDSDDVVAGSKGIIYPTPRNLRLDVKSSKETFRPAEDATLDFSVSSPDELTSENALGVFILDKAVEERALTDSNFGGGFDTFGSFQGLLGNTKSFGGLTQNDIEELDLSKPISDDVQLAAEVMLYKQASKPNFFKSYYRKDLRNIFYSSTYKQFIKARETLSKVYYKTNEFPTDAESFKRILGRNGVVFDAIKDPWDNKYQVTSEIEKQNYVLKIWSSGADKRFEPESPSSVKDDFVVLEMRFNYFIKTGKKINEAVQEHYQKTGEFVRDDATLRKALIAKDINFDKIKDNWGEPYRAEFGASNRNYTIKFRSGGKDKKFDNNYATDFIIWTTATDYFYKTQAKIGKIVNDYSRKEKKYPKNTAEFKQVLKDGGIDFDELQDGWGNPFYIKSKINKRFADRVSIENVAKEGEKPQEKYVVRTMKQEFITFNIVSLGATGKKNDSYWLNPLIAGFAGIISEGVKDNSKPKLEFPKELLLSGKSAIWGTITDPAGAALPRVNVKLENPRTGFSKTVKSNEAGIYLIKGVSPAMYNLRVSSSGFQTVIVKRVALLVDTLNATNVTLNVGNVNSIVEVTTNITSVVNTSDASIGNIFIPQQITQLPTNLRRVNDILALQPGVTRQGFVAGARGTTFSSLLQISPNVRNETLASGFQIDGASGGENVFIIDGQEVTNFKNGTLNTMNYVVEEDKDSATAKTKKETPRIRNYFPETLLWNPEVITDANGKATLKFKLADNITTWKIYAIASNLEGEIGVAKKEIKAFQPFFVDLLPPKILTKGDEIYLPVQVRNYTKDEQKVDVEMTKADWFSFLNAETRTSVSVQNSLLKQIAVPKNSTQNAVFGFRAENVTDEGFQKVTAIADKESDAIEKPVKVKPDGKEVIQTESEIFTDSITLNANFPNNALSDTQKAEIKLYPNLFAHVAESVEGLLKRPYGCGEQTISSTYPNLMILKFAGEDNRLRPIAKKYLQKGYERLLGYQVSNGGFSYWGGKDKANLALTAYALRFLSDTDGFIEVDENVVNKARHWLISRQDANGFWTQSYYGENSVIDKRRTWQITTYVAKSLAMTERNKTKKNENVQKALSQAFEYLNERNTKIDEPYSLANWGLALIDSDKLDETKAIAEKLEKLAVREGDSEVYWKLESNTPFYGWGRAGKIETTALVVEFLTRFSRKDVKEERKNLISKGTMFLLKNKDRYGVWYSTQTTINVLNAFLAAIGKDGLESSKEKRIAEIFVNGQKVKDLELPPAGKLAFPLTIRVDAVLTPQQNKFEIKTNDGVAMMAQVVQNHYISWSDFFSSNADINQSRQMSLQYTCDKQKTEITQEITCDVNAERVGFKGYGMLLAEIGIPPGADVDRASLEKAKDEDRSFSHYDVLPDRIIVYMWSKAGGTSFQFKFKPRYGINAQTPPSFVYDYYNEEAKAIVAPKRFEVE